MADSRHRPPEDQDEEARQNPYIGKGDTWNVAGSDAQQPEIAEGPVEGLEPGEHVERGPWRPPVEVDPPPNPAATDPDGGPREELGQERAQAEGPGAPSDPGRAPEEEGVPDLQDGTPEQQQANDPQQQPVPGDTPTAVTQDPPTPTEMREGQSLEERLTEEEPEPDTAQALRGQADPSTGDSPASDTATVDGRTGLLHDGSESAPFRHQDIFAEEADAEGLSAEEEAVRTRNEDDR